MSNGIEKPKGKVWNISGSFTGSSNLIPEGATYTKLEVLPNSLDTYYDGELFRMDLTYFRATFVDQEGQETKIDIPSKQVDAKFDTNVPFSNNQETSIRVHLEFEWTYSPTEGEEQHHDCEFVVTVWPEKFTVQKLEVIVPPSKTVYYDGETFQHSGMVVQATSEEGDTKEVPYCGGPRCSEDRDCYYYSQTPLHAGDSETVEVIFEYCAPADGEHPNGYRAQFAYPVTVYKDERKAQLKVTYDADTTKQLYYSGEKFNSTGIKVQKKYPRDDDSEYENPDNQVTTACKIYIQEFTNGVLQYNDTNMGYLNLVVEYYDDQTQLTTTEVISNIIFVYEVSGVTVSTARKDEFYVGDTFQTSYATLRVDYKPDSLPLDSYENFKMSNSYTWSTSSYINSAGKFLLASEKTSIKLNYTDEKDPKSPKTVYSTNFDVVINKQLKKMPVPKYTGNTTYTSGGIQILKYLGVTSGNSLTQGYDDISVNGVNNYKTKISESFTATSSQYQYTIGVTLVKNDPTYTYVWDDGYDSTAEVTKTVQVDLKIIVKQSINLTATANRTSLTSTNTNSSSGYPSASVDVGTGGVGLPDQTTFRATVTTGTAYVYLDTNNITGYLANFNVTASGDSILTGTQSSTVRFSADSIVENDPWRESTTSFNYDDVTFSIKFRDPWNWNSNTYSTLTNYTTCNNWWSGFKSNITTSNARNYVGRRARVFFNSGTSSTSYIDFYYTSYVSGVMFFRSADKVTMTAYGANSGRFTEDTSTSLVNQWSGGSTNPQKACKTLQSNGSTYCSNWYSLATTISKYYGVSTGTASSSTSCTAKTSYKIWLPSYRELFGSPSSNDARIIRECTDSYYTYESCLSGYSTSGTFWIRNGSYAATPGVNTQRVATYYSTSAISQSDGIYHVARVGLPDQSTSTPGSGIYLAFCIQLGGSVG